MTGRTHDLAAFSSISFIAIYFASSDITLATLITSLGACLIGGIFPDIDKASSDAWSKIPGGSLLGKLIAPLLGGHRMISHSLLGLFLTGLFLNKILLIIHSVLIVDMSIVWYAFMIGYVSHIIMDSLTKEGIPLLFPIPWTIGIPPLKLLRITTGSWIEKFVIYPGLLIANAYLYLKNYHSVLSFIQHHIH